MMRPMGLSCLLLAALLCMQAANASEWMSGIATFTGSEDPNARTVPNGSCGYGELSADQYPGFMLAGVALDISVFKNKALKGCGTCVEVRCQDEVCNTPSKTLTVMLYDNCDKCSPEQVNLQALPFKQLAPLDIGRIKVQFREVPCRFNGGVVVNIDRFRASAGGWVRMMFKNVNGSPVTHVDFTKSGADSWRGMSNNFGAAWEASRLPELPWDIKLTNAEGQSIVLKNIVTSEKIGEMVSGSNFLPAGETPKQPEPPKAEPPKQEPPKQEPPKADPPKQEPPKADPPKQEPPKSDEQKKLEELEQRKKRLEEEWKREEARRQEELKKLEEELKRLEEQKRLEEKKKLEEQQHLEEQKRLEEKKRQEEEQRHLEEWRKQLLDELKRLEEEEKRLADRKKNGGSPAAQKAAEANQKAKDDLLKALIKKAESM